MKKAMMIVVVIATTGLTACAQKIDATKVPAVVKASFSKQFPGITAKWEKEKNEYEAGFKQNGNTMSASYKTDGALIETEMDIKIADVPATVLSYVKEHYKGKDIKEAAKITKADGAINYEAEVNGKDLIFDVNGNFIKEMKE